MFNVLQYLVFCYEDYKIHWFTNLLSHKEKDKKTKMHKNTERLFHAWCWNATYSSLSTGQMVFPRIVSWSTVVSRSTVANTVSIFINTGHGLQAKQLNRGIEEGKLNILFLLLQQIYLGVSPFVVVLITRITPKIICALTVPTLEQLNLTLYL